MLRIACCHVLQELGTGEAVWVHNVGAPCWRNHLHRSSKRLEKWPVLQELSTRKEAHRRHVTLETSCGGTLLETTDNQEADPLSPEEVLLSHSILYTKCFSSVQFSHSVMSDSLCPHGLQHARPPVHHQLPEFTQTHVHWLGDAVQPSHPLSSPSPPTLNLSQQQGLFKWVSSLYQVAKVLEFQLQHQSFHWIFRTGFL